MSTRLSPTAAFYLQASLTVSFLAGSSAPTPLYPVYQAAWGSTPTTTTIIFGSYAIAVLLALLFTGRLSDHVGRRPVLLVATIAQAFTMFLFATAHDVPDLLIARIVQGLTTGAAVAAIGAGMIDIDKTRGTVANAVAPAFGTASGALLAGIMVQYLPSPTHLVYVLFGAIYVLQAIALSFMEDSISPRAGALASLKPQLKLPAATRTPMLLALPVLIAVWALAGFYGSLGPMLLRGMLESSSALFGGLALFVLAASGGVSVLVLQHREPRGVMLYGALALLGGVGLSVIALHFHSVSAFFVGTALAGTGFGSGFQGAVRTVVPQARPHERAGVLSLIFVVSYLSMGVPAVFAGLRVAQYGDVIGTAQIFGEGVMALALLAVFGMTARRRYALS